MKNSLRLKVDANSIIFVIVGVNALSLLCAGIFFPPANLVIGLAFGLYFYYLTYSAPSKSLLWQEIRVFFVAVVGISLGSLSLNISCQFLPRMACLPNEIKAQIFGNYAFALGPLVISWLGYRLPAILRGHR